MRGSVRALPALQYPALEFRGGLRVAQWQFDQFGVSGRVFCLPVIAEAEEVVRPRHVQIIPGYYAALLMHWHGISAKTAYQEVHGVMQACGRE